MLLWKMIERRHFQLKWSRRSGLIEMSGGGAAGAQLYGLLCTARCNTIHWKINYTAWTIQLVHSCMNCTAPHSLVCCTPEWTAYTAQPNAAVHINILHCAAQQHNMQSYTIDCTTLHSHILQRTARVTAQYEIKMHSHCTEYWKLLH